MRKIKLWDLEYKLYIQWKLIDNAKFPYLLDMVKFYRNIKGEKRIRSQTFVFTKNVTHNEVR